MATSFERGRSRSPRLPAGEPRLRRRFDDHAMLRAVLAKPLLDLIEKERDTETELRRKLGAIPAGKGALILDEDFPGGLPAAADAVRAFIAEHFGRMGRKPPRNIAPVRGHPAILLGKFSGRLMDELMDANDELGGPLENAWPRSWNVIIDINLKFETKDPQPVRSDPSVAHAANLYNADPRLAARDAIEQYIDEAIGTDAHPARSEGRDVLKTRLSNQYVFARLGARALFHIIRRDRETALELASRQPPRQPPQPGHGDQDSKTVSGDLRYRAIHQVWPDFHLHSCVYRSARTVKADAAQNAFSAFGEGITWAVIDSGIDYRHPHFSLNSNIDPISPFHADFTGEGTPLVDAYGHGTHVAGIIAGQQCADRPPRTPPAAPYTQEARLRSAANERMPLDEFNDEFKVEPKFEDLHVIAGIAPRCKLVSLKVLDSGGRGMASNVIAAIAYIQQINGHGRDLKIHGVNISLGHEFDPVWFACGHSPLCVEVNRLVKSGVVVVVAAGNTGYGTVVSDEGQRKSGLDMSINDPGNADLAITVGATHRDAPYRYGVSFFSSKGPTGDGRSKPDLVAPGERIISSAQPGTRRFPVQGTDYAYAEMTGTSMAAPHVSGAVAAFLSIRQEFVGEAERVKQIFIDAATDLGRERYFQGAGMVDLLRAIQSV